MRMKWTLAAMLVVVASLFGGSPAEAAKCTITTTPIAFGIYNVFSAAPVDSVGSLLFDCIGAKTVSIAISQGQSGRFQPRTLKSGTESLYYNLFLDAARSTVWGNGSGGTETYITDPGKDPVNVTIYGRIPPEQDVTFGSYADSVTVTINF